MKTGVVQTWAKCFRTSPASTAEGTYHMAYVGSAVKRDGWLIGTRPLWYLSWSMNIYGDAIYGLPGATTQFYCLGNWKPIPCLLLGRLKRMSGFLAMRWLYPSCLKTWESCSVSTDFYGFNFRNEFGNWTALRKRIFGNCQLFVGLSHFILLPVMRCLRKFQGNTFLVIRKQTWINSWHSCEEIV